MIMEARKTAMQFIAMQIAERTILTVIAMNTIRCKAINHRNLFSE